MSNFLKLLPLLSLMAIALGMTAGYYAEHVSLEQWRDGAIAIVVVTVYIVAVALLL